MQARIGATVVLFDDDYEMEVCQQIKQSSTTILSSTFSFDGAQLVCGTKDGKLMLWDMEKKASDFSSSSRPLVADKAFVAHGGPIYSLLFINAGTNAMLVSGGDDGVALWSWQNVLGGVFVPVTRLHSKSNGRQPEINSLINFDDKLVAASGDGNIYVWDFHTSQIVNTLSGHKDGVYCVSRVNEHALCSGGEDGIVHLWDVRTSTIVKSLEHCTGKVGTSETPLGPPGKHTPFISCLSVDPSSEFLVCGGGARILSLWSLTADKVLATMPTAGNPQAVIFYKNGLVSAGNDRFVYQWEREGKMVTRVKTNAPSVFTISHAAMGDADWLASAGTGQLVDLISEAFAVESSLACFD